jgi:tRNA modification GTPase
MDLSQAEAVADLIAASSEQAVALAGRQLEGRLSKYVGKLRNEIKVMRAQMEAMIDFPEDEDVQGLRYEEILERVRSVKDRILALLTTYEEGRVLREGIRVALVGKPNVGKSSLFNALLNDDRSIVHPTPGTTRDTVEEVLHLEGLSVRFIDTAGIREGQDGIEGEGIQRSQKKIEQSDLVLFVLDGSRPWEVADDRIRSLTEGRRSVWVVNKCDLAPAFDAPASSLKVSATEGRGLEALKEAIRSPFQGREARPQDPGVTLSNLRHRTALEKGLEALEKVSEGAQEKRSLELLAADLALAMNRLGEITGEVTTDEILGEIFSKFCIGK